MCKNITVEQLGKSQGYCVDFLKILVTTWKPKTSGLPSEISHKEIKILRNKLYIIVIFRFNLDSCVKNISELYKDSHKL